MTNKHLRCSFFSGKGFFSYGQYFIFKTSESVLWTTSKKALLDLPAIQAKGLIQGYVHQHAKILRVNVHENRQLLPAKLKGVCRKDFYCLLGSRREPENCPHPPSPTHLLHLKQSFTFLDIKTHKPFLHIAFNIQFHLTCEKDRQVLMGKTVLYTTVLKTSHPRQPFSPPSVTHVQVIFINILSLQCPLKKTNPSTPSQFSHNQAWKDYNYTKS